jgi:GH15 family glucan-1,4-alpha-glucosidase
MSRAIEDYAMISDCRTAALVGNDGSIDWLCLPRYDSASTFGALLGSSDHGRWLLAPVDDSATAVRQYRGNSFVLVTRWTTATGVVEVTDLMPHGNHRADVIRRIHGISGTVELQEELVIRFGYADNLPWVRQLAEADDHHLVAIAGPDGLVRRGPRLTATDHRHRGTLSVSQGETVDLSITWFPAHRPIPGQINVTHLIEQTVQWWEDWAANCSYTGPHHREVVRSLLVLRALTHEDTGGIVAAATTSLPESFGGTRNWDYRYVWLRDASLTLTALLAHGYTDEALNWREWLLRAVAGDPEDVQIMYGLAGERELPERELASLPGYQGASPVRVGNGASTQFQADVIGEVMLALDEARAAGHAETDLSWPLQRALLGFVENNWNRTDNGIWEIRGQERHFTHSRVMMWVALDRAVKAVRESGLPGPVERWEHLRERVRTEIETKGFDVGKNSYVQYYGGTEVDASLLILSQVGYCEPTDPRMLGTVAAIETDLMRDGLVMRYRTESSVDGLPPGEHPFLACSFWLVQQWAASGRVAEAQHLMKRLCSFANDVGLLSEEYDPGTGHQVGNTPQALSHLALVGAASALAKARRSTT